MKKLLEGLTIAFVLALVGLTTASAQEHKKALILIEYQNDWLAPTGGINAQFKDRGQFETALKIRRLCLRKRISKTWKSSMSR